MSLVEDQVAAIREIQELWPEAQIVIIGATALGFYFDMSWRHTADVDLVLALTLDALPDLLHRPVGAGILRGNTSSLRPRARGSI